MGYRSQVYLKTTTEGWLLLKRANDRVKEKEDKPLAYAEVQKTETGFYKITYDDIKWYEGYTQINNFNKVLEEMEEQDIPYSFIRLGEDVEDIEHRRSYPDDMPDEIETFEPVSDVNDEDYGSYSFIDLDDESGE